MKYVLCNIYSVGNIIVDECRYNGNIGIELIIKEYCKLRFKFIGSFVYVIWVIIILLLFFIYVCV